VGAHGGGWGRSETCERRRVGKVVEAYFVQIASGIESVLLEIYLTIPVDCCVSCI